MLVEFRTKNFRSLRDEQVLSLATSKDTTFENTHTMATGIKAIPKLLCSTVLYGANASGKSNLIKALQCMRKVVVESAVIQPGQSLDSFGRQPFRLDPNSANSPTEFEITFILQGVRYQYGFKMTSERIIHEYLLVYKAFKPQCWFERSFDSKLNKDIYEFGAAFKGSKKLWEGATRPNVLFLSTAVQLNSEILQQVFNWFVHGLAICNEHETLNPGITIQMLKQIEKQKICAVLNAADTGIENIEVVTKKVPAKNFHWDLLSDKTEIQNKEIEEHKLFFHHTTEQNKAIFEWMDESSGTRALLFLTGSILDILNKGLTLVVDELDTSLHTLLVRQLIGLFHNPELNKHGAQLIFTTHDTALLDAPGLFRRDQIWFVNKDRDQASELVSLAEFSPRKNEALERGYLTGRYDGVPFLPNNLGLQH